LTGKLELIEFKNINGEGVVAKIRVYNNPVTPAKLEASQV